ncbi:hypothetical protein AHMF7605_19700 [Adhaeribacter arboris]|uniref:DUF2961 domain-containing protein n=1 Tax=Adhaeribacter arboris TaxID=2072846 RepID=A0A2T2YJ93_9BACT|nr:glycoside hydrolase family 172 protein [Adhaeribacter arboris]PSR55571.1 hypothetical protein AHMF7605_19700 [Adhaeribacter arboris]
MKNIVLLLTFLYFGITESFAQNSSFTGLETNLENLFRISDAKSRSISPENITGEKGKGGMTKLENGSAAHAARDLGIGWKVNPYLVIKPGESAVMGEITGSGAIKHMWMATIGGNWRFMIIKIYWDDEKTPSVEVPMGDFFCSGWGRFSQVSSLAVCVNPGSGFNSYWVMPFRKKARIVMENINTQPLNLYYQIDYTLTEVPTDAGYFHAQFRRVNPLPYKQVYTLIDNVKGKGQFVGAYMAWGVNNNGWWGEGEIKFYLDGDKDFPTINGTGTEDYFCGSHNFENPHSHQYQEFTTPYSGLHQIIRPDGLYQAQQRFGMYRWHISDPIRFEKDLRVTIQALGWRGEGKYLPLMDDIASVVYWYQAEPHNTFPKLPSRDELEVN